MKRKLSILLSVLLVISFALTLAGCGNTEPAPSSGGEIESITLIEGHTAPEDHATTMAMKKFAQLLEEKTDGKVKVQINPNQALGQERDVVEGLQLGTVDMTVTSTGPLGGFVSDINIIDFPFLFRDYDHAHKVLDGEIGQNLLDKFETANIKGLAYWDLGFRQVTNSKHAITKPEDFKGLKLRTMENKVHISTFQALGAEPIPMAWGEVFTSLEQGLLHGQENPINIIYGFKVHEVQDYLSITNHLYGPHVVLMSQATWDKLSEEVQDIIMEILPEATQYQRDLIAQQDEEQLTAIRNANVNVNEVNMEPFIEATKDVYEQYKDLYNPELLEQIRAVK